MRILVADSLDPSAVAGLEGDGHGCVVEPALTAETLPDAIGGFEAVVVRSTKVTSAAIDAGTDLRLVVRAGSGTNTIDCPAATTAGVAVANVPGRNAVAVAELTLGLLLAVDRRIPDSVVALREGRWEKKELSKGARGLQGSTLGIVGLGSIGLAVAERARAFGMTLLALERPGRPQSTVDQVAALGIRLVDSLPALAAEVDVLTLHIPAGPGTAGVVDEEVLSSMRPGAILLNTSRADIVDPAALLRALDSGRLRAGLDVFPDEPATGSATWSSPIAAHPAVVGTHHVGASTQQSQVSVARGVVEVVEAFVAGKPIHVVNPEVTNSRSPGPEGG
jgi:D-3-phosphoglycerate dehydrogenase